VQLVTLRASDISLIFSMLNRKKLTTMLLHGQSRYLSIMHMDCIMLLLTLLAASNEIQRQGGVSTGIISAALT
jgi:hypothetical protein